ncbi:MAG: DUF952 domain-containing protein [Pseudomonadota bacterium]
MLVFKLLTADEAAILAADGRFEGSPADLADGFVHLSTAEQVPGTAAKHFAGRGLLTVLALEAEPLGDALQWEPSRGGALFPHLYRPLLVADIAWRAGYAPSADGTWPAPRPDRP